MKQLSLCLSFIIAFSFISCDKEEIKATVPAFLEIDEISVSKKDSSRLGSNSSNIVDAWVFVNDRLIGAFELPARIPILELGNTNIKIRGGIFNNGASNTRVIYDFYEFYDSTFFLEAEQVLKPDIVVDYRVNSEINPDFAPIEDFENGTNFQASPNSETRLVPTSDQGKVFEGEESGIAALNENQTFFEAYTQILRNVPRDGRTIYMEFDYKSTHDFRVSIYVNGRTTQIPFVTVRARSEWNKIYLDFGNVFSNIFDANDYNIAFGYTKPSGEEGELLLDNVKLLQF